ncbi:hypothetical protein MBLNU230_g4190t1 [Neophaeotheca triangularis]
MSAPSNTGAGGGSANKPSWSNNINPHSSAFIPARRKVKKMKPHELPPDHPGYRPLKGSEQANGAGAPTPPQASQTQSSNAPAQDMPVQPAQPVPPEGHYTEYPLLISKSSLADGMRYHAMKFASKLDSKGKPIVVNPYDPTKFPRPVRLLRHPIGQKKQVIEEPEEASGGDDKEREILSAKRAERQAEREANQALIAPAGNEEAKKQQKKRKIPKIQDIYYDDTTEQYQKRAKLRYEEKMPWHLEDADHKNDWVGSYVEGLSESNVLFTIEGGGFRMIPVEKWYRFAPTNKFQALSSEQAEAIMAKKHANPRWFMKTQDADEKRQEIEAYERAKAMKQKYGDDIYKDMQEEARERAKVKAERNDDRYQGDKDEIDFEFTGEFDDDDEGRLFGEDETENKEVEKRLRDEQRQFNLFKDLKEGDDKDWDAEELEEAMKTKEERRAQRKTRKALVKRERQFAYEEDSDSDAKYDSSSDESEDDEETERKAAEEEKAKASGEQSGSSTKGTNTPSGRQEKRDQSKGLGASLKRPGSPSLSDASGSEANRKKAKGVNGRAVRPGSPGSTSPNNSRAGSPAGNRPVLVMPTEVEVRAAIPNEGIHISALAAKFRHQLPKDPDASKRFIAIVKTVAYHDKESRLTFLKEKRKPGET